MIKAIIFDWHGVLDETKFDDLLVSLSKQTNQPKEKVITKLLISGRAYSAGLMEPEKFWPEIQTKFGLDDIELKKAQESILSIRKYLPLWERIEALAKLYKFAILSDCSIDKAAMIRDRVNLRDFSVVHFSCEKKVTKNDKEFFEGIVAELNVPREQILYVDDTYFHLITAESLGMQTCHFHTIDDLNNALKKQFIPARQG